VSTLAVCCFAECSMILFHVSGPIPLIVLQGCDPLRLLRIASLLFVMAFIIEVAEGLSSPMFL